VESVSSRERSVQLPPGGDVDLLDEDTVIDYLVDRGMTLAGDHKVERLSGGVSNVVLRVSLPERDLVLKQALGLLAVADEWRADRNRAHTEAEALRYLGSLGQVVTPAVIDEDPERFTLCIEAAPRSWETLKASLMRGNLQSEVVTGLARSLAQWHRRSQQDVTHGLLPESLDGRTAFEQLRLDPYFAVTARRHPEASGLIKATALEIAARRSCLVLGDFSPKNVLVGDMGAGDYWVIDLEVAHVGDPTFDVAFMSTHLLLKWLHLPEHRAELRTALESFLEEYGDGPGAVEAEHLRRTVACLLLARACGSSPAEYLTNSERARVIEGGSRLLRDAAPHSWIEVFDEA